MGSRAARPVAARVVLALTVAVQLVVLYDPSPPAVADGAVPGLDKVVHVAVFAAVAWTGRRAGVPGWVLAAVLGGHAVLSEVVQATVLPAREGDPLDVVADVVGVALGLLPRRLWPAPAGTGSGGREGRRPPSGP